MRPTVAMLVIALAVACGGAARTDPGLTATDALTGDITVFAAASLTDAFARAGDAMRARYPRAHLTFNFGSSSTLATQIANGAPADVFASADEASMQKVIDAKLVDGAPAVFATNRLQIAVAAGNPKRIRGLADLARGDLTVVLAAPTVPAGRYAIDLLARAGVRVRPASEEVDVRAVLNKVALGEADAGIVYVTDVLSAGSRVSAVDIAEAQQVVARYPIAVVARSSNAPLARAYVEHLLSDDGQRILAQLGFSRP